MSTFSTSRFLFKCAEHSPNPIFCAGWLNHAGPQFLSAVCDQSEEELHVKVEKLCQNILCLFYLNFRRLFTRVFLLQKQSLIAKFLLQEVGHLLPPVELLSSQHLSLYLPPSLSDRVLHQVGLPPLVHPYLPGLSQVQLIFLLCWHLPS